MKSFIFLILSFFISSFSFATKVAVIADSIGVGIKGTTAFPVLLEKSYEGKIEFIKNCRGSTCIATGLSRLEGILKDGNAPDILIYTLGVNNARAFRTPIRELYWDLCRTIKLAQENGIIVMIGYIDVTSFHSLIKNEKYEKDFENLYKQLESEFGIILFPFLFKEFISQEIHTFDGFHPTQIGYDVMTEIIKRKLDLLLGD